MEGLAAVSFGDSLEDTASYWPKEATEELEEPIAASKVSVDIQGVVDFGKAFVEPIVVEDITAASSDVIDKPHLGNLVALESGFDFDTTSSIMELIAEEEAVDISSVAPHYSNSMKDLPKQVQ